MKPIDLARKLAALNSVEEAQSAYALVIHQGADPAETMEAAIYILQSGGDYKISYTCFRDLYNQGHFREDILPLMLEAFYKPNLKELQGRYERNCKLLKKYPYLFRKDFLSFDKLPVLFFPYDNNGYVPFYPDQQQFGEYINFENPVISRNFFHDLEKPVLADDVFSQYELEYLNDNVRKSEDVGRENHVYLHYANWGAFCAHLSCLNLRPLLEDQKLVFLIGDEIEQYPIDFKARFGIDYSHYPVKKIGVREVKRLIWHTQLSAHNGGDFFNEVFDQHPNLLVLPSVMLDDIEEQIHSYESRLDEAASLKDAQERIPNWSPETISELYRMKKRTTKDVMVAAFLHTQTATSGLDWEARIVPAVFFQPHVENIVFRLLTDTSGNTRMEAPPLEAMHRTPLLQGFKYIKTFTPMRRFTTSYAATVSFSYHITKVYKQLEVIKDNAMRVVSDSISERVFNRSFMIDPEDRLYKDSILVRFEDGKLNSKATFTALAAFLDLPYTESMTYCSENGRRDPHSETKGFDPAPVYKNYDEFANDEERYFIEYFLRDAYKYYGYDFQYYDGAVVDEAKIEELLSGFTTIDHYMRETWKPLFDLLPLKDRDGNPPTPEQEPAARAELLENYIQSFKEKRRQHVQTLIKTKRFVSRTGQPLRFMRKLEPDPALLEQPLYH